MNIYIPPTDEKNEALGSIVAFLEANTKCHKQYDIIIGGDFNCERDNYIIKTIEKNYMVQVIEGNLK